MVDVGLVLTGGGARGAYQVGAILALSEIMPDVPTPFRVLTGVSSGAINIMPLGAAADDFRRGAQRLFELWSQLTPERVYRTDPPKLAQLGIRWLKDLTMGGALGTSRANHLLDTSPLRELLKRELDCSQLSKHIAEGRLRGVAVSATNYLTGNTVTFFDGAPHIEPWVRGGRIAVREAITADHVLASASIPVFFPPVRIGGKVYGDGQIRMTTPLGPAIHLGAQKIVAIALRYRRTGEQTLAMNLELEQRHVSIAQIAGVVLNSVFLDSLDNDLERMQRINRTISLFSAEQRERSPDLLRRILALVLRPSQDLGRLAADQYDKFPAMLRHLLRGIGAIGESGWDLLSYVAFEPDYIRQLIDLGHRDTMARRREIEDFFSASVEDALG